MKARKAISFVLYAVMLSALLLSACSGTDLPAAETPPASADIAPSDAAPSATAAPASDSAPPAASAIPQGGQATPDASSPQPAQFTFTADNMPRIDGSTATIPLISAVQSVLLGIPRPDDVTVSGTDNAYTKLIEGNTDILLVYAPAPDSLEYAGYKGVTLEMAPIGKDALVFLINKKNPVSDLTPDQLVGIYSGRITNWKDVGGKDVEIKAFQRQLISGSQTMMNKLVMKDVPMAETEAEYIIGDMGGLVNAIATYDNAESAIGYNVYYYVSRMKMDENIRLLSINGVAPSSETIASGDYPFVNEFYAVIRSDAPAGSPERILFDWIQSDDGQALVKHEGYVNMTMNN